MWEQGGRSRRGARGERLMVPDATFSSYYGRPVVKQPVWAERDIAGYLFTGGLAGGTAIIAAGADLTGRPHLRRVSRLTSAGALGVSFVALVHDLGRPARFVNMLRVFKPTSPMSVGTWFLSAFAPGIGAAALAELPGLVPPPLRGVVTKAARPGTIASALVAPAVATYTAVLFADTSVPTWHEAYPELPFLFAGSALAASSGVGLIGAPAAETAPVRRLAVVGAALDLAASRLMESRMGLLGEPLKQGKSGTKLKAARALTALGALGTVTLAKRSRAAAVASGAALFAGSVLTRFGFFEAGVASVADPKYVVVPQRQRIERGDRVRD
jgi:DMSO reductase anchor subunit